ncbi:MAG: choice-of-anchor tandem repeat GloVer-containing protein [Candidatus Sulfotelmatobacter sp.]
MAAAMALAIIATESAQAQTLITLHSFARPQGTLPRAGLILATDGNLYGTTYQGGANDEGAVFKITPSGGLTTLYSFCSQSSCADGSSPYAGLIQATDGNFYGTTYAGGAGNEGTIFKITLRGTLTTLHSFDGADGAYPYAGLIQATDGDFYGTTWGGGANNDAGTVFKITSDGTLTTLYSFCSISECLDGVNPWAGLVQGTDGSFYGTNLGGLSNEGTVFTITPDGTLTTLHSFDYTDGAYPYAGLVQATNGNFYGTTFEGGARGDGTVFKITSSGTLTTQHSFDGADGNGPYAGLVQATDGNLYGTTFEGNTVFKIIPGGRLTTLYTFDGADGVEPLGVLIQATNGDLYGTTYEGGAKNLGTVFSLSVGLGPFVETQPAFGKIGAEIKILGTDLTNASSVTFNGTAAAFTVVSASLITATVPAGATTGTVQVVTPNGALNSNVRFRVSP